LVNNFLEAELDNLDNVEKQEEVFTITCYVEGVETPILYGKYYITPGRGGLIITDITTKEQVNISDFHCLKARMPKFEVETNY